MIIIRKSHLLTPSDNTAWKLDPTAVSHTVNLTSALTHTKPRQTIYEISQVTTEVNNPKICS